MVMPHAMALISVAFPPALRARALGVFSSVTGLGTLGGPLVGGAITQGLDWQWIFWVNVPLGALLIPLAARRIPESTAAARRLDFGGLALVAAGVLGLVWGLVRAGAVGWTSAEVTGALVTGAVLMAAFIVWELRTREPMLPMGFFRSAAFSAGNASGFLLYASLAGSAFFLAQFLQVTLRFGPLGAGVRLAPWTASVFVFSWFAGAMVNRVGERVLIVGGLALQAAGFGWISLIADPGLDYPAMVAPLVITGFGTALATPATQNCVISAVPRTAIGAAAGVFNTLRQLGSTFGIAILAAVFASYGSYASPQAFNRGFVPAAGVAAGLSVAAAIAGCWAPRNRAARTPTPEPQRQEPVLQPQV
jgi:EmrB/QacA subfamily drug resistance transporter